MPCHNKNTNFTTQILVPQHEYKFHNTNAKFHNTNTSCHNTNKSRHNTNANANSSRQSFEENIRAFRSRLHARGYPGYSEVKFEERKSALQQKKRPYIKILPLVTQYPPAIPGGGVLPYIRYIGMCRPKGYGF